MLRTLQKSAPLALTALIGALAACSSSSDDATPTETGTLTGSVLNAPNPVGGVKVSVRGAGGTFTTTTSSNGTYTLTGIPSGEYTIDLCGQGVFDSNGDPIADKINLHLPGSQVGSGSQAIGRGPVFLPERALGLAVDTAGTNEGMIAAGTVVTNPAAGVAIVFAEATTVTFLDPNDTTISITPVPVEQLPVALPNGLSTNGAFAIEPAGATFDVRPRVTFANVDHLPVGTQDVPIYRLNYGTGQWVPSGTGTVSASGASILSDAGEGLRATGWHTTIVETFCETNVRGRVTGGFGEPLAGALVATVGGLTTETNANGDFVIESVPLPSDNFDVVVTIVPAPGSGFAPDESSAIVGMCGTDTEMGTISLSSIVVDETAPVISASVPSDGAVDVADNSSVTVTFDELMSPGSLNEDTLTLRAAGMQVDGEIGVSHSGGQTTVTFLPTTALAVDTEYNFRVGAAVMDAAGNRLGSTELISFTTASDVAGGTPTVTVTPGAPPAILPGDATHLSVGVLDAAGSNVNGALVTWTSDAPAVATVDATGFVTATAPGSATVRAAFGGTFDEVTITVNTPVINTIVLSGTSPVMAIGSGLTLVAEAQDAGGNRLTGFTLDWTSSDDSIATVDANGNVSALSAGGPVTITATEPNSSADASFAITIVDPANVTSVEVLASTDAIGPGTALQLSAIGRDNQQETVPGVTFTWASSNGSIAQVNANGLVTATGQGTVQITATADGGSQASGSTDLDVFPYEPTIVRIVRPDPFASPLSDVFVILTDPVTGTTIDGTGTDENGFADFGFTDSPRVTVTYTLFSQNAPLEGGYQGDYAFTAMNVPVGRMTMMPDMQPEYYTSVDASFPTGSDTVQAAAGAFNESYPDVVQGVMSPANLFIVSPGSGDWPILAATYSSASATGGILSGGFFEPTLSDGFDISMTLTAEAVSSIPFNSNSSMLFAGARFLKDGLIYDQDSGVTEPSTTGVASSVAPPGAERYGYRFMTRSETTGVSKGRDAYSDTEPSSLTPGVPSMGVRNLALDVATRTLSWETTGTAASGLDVGRARFEFSQGFGGNAVWEVLFDPTDLSLVLPSDKGIPVLSPQNLSTDVELYNLTGVAGYDSTMAEFRAQNGRINHTMMSATNRVDFVGAGVSMFEFEVNSPFNGMVTYDFGEGPITVADGATVSIPTGVPVTITATANTGLTVTEMHSTQGEVTGVGTQTATVTIDSNEYASFVEVGFQSPAQ